MPSTIADFFDNSTILLTGVTGFLGKAFLEKLLRTSHVKRFYLLIRAKKGKDSELRCKEIFQEAIFQRVKEERPDFLARIVLVQGDFSLPLLGLKAEDRKRLASEVNCVIHCAASVRFDEKLSAATQVNLKSLVDLVGLVREMTCLKAVLYVSTAYSNCSRGCIEERVYEPPMKGRDLMKVVDALEEEVLEEVTPLICGDYPNTYVFTKCLAEDLLKEEGVGLPIAICRPSIIVGSVRDPLPGWVDNFYGTNGVLAGCLVGVIRTLRLHEEKSSDMVPVDYVINCCLAILWDTASRKPPKIQTFNFVKSPEDPFSWGYSFNLAWKHAYPIPSVFQAWHILFHFTRTDFGSSLDKFVYHTLPAHICDTFAKLLGKKPQMVKLYGKIDKFEEVITYFTTQEWRFKNENVQNLWKKLQDSDREIFPFSMENFDWDSYFSTYLKGLRVFLVKDPLETVPEGRKRYRILMLVHYTLLFLLILLILGFFLICGKLFL